MSPIIERPGQKLSSMQFEGPQDGLQYSNFQIDWSRGKKIKFTRCDFSSSLIRNCYFHQAVFVECNFTGATIQDSNFRGATFSDCKFEYCIFRNTLVDSTQMLANLPSWENVRRELLRNLRKNAESIGEIEEVRSYFRQEMRASWEHWRFVWKKPSAYYQSHYPGFVGRIKAGFQLTCLLLHRNYWGYGESVLRLAIFTMITLTLLATYVRFSTTWSADITFTQLLSAMGATLAGFNQPIAQKFSVGFALLFGIFRLFSFGMVSSLLIRRFARR